MPDTTPAFARSGYDSANTNANTSQIGMTIRDYFAAQFMAANLPKKGQVRTSWQDLLAATATEAYEIADAMMSAR